MSKREKGDDHPAPDRPDPPPTDNLLPSAIDRDLRLSDDFREAYERMTGRVVEIHKAQREIHLGGGEQNIEKQHAKGRLTAR
ncbi:hypothetical protein ACFL4Y_03290, partial [Gemmatimonadota bacterium]